MESSIKLRAIDLKLIEDLFDMGGGGVLDFSNRTFFDFFNDELQINIDDQHYYAAGSSKAKRLRYFFRISNAEDIRRVLLALWEYREYNRVRNKIDESIPNAEHDFYSLIVRLGGERPKNSQKPPTPTADIFLDPAAFSSLKNELIALSSLKPHERGYAFEKFLKNLFDLNGLMARASFRIVGEQIDGSFELSSETYLLEAKWTQGKIGATDLHSFNGKVEGKATWSRGLFVSESGFSEDGLVAFGSGKRLVCMDGLDLYDMLEKNLPFSDVMSKKVRRAAESGKPFVRVRDLF